MYFVYFSLLLLNLNISLKMFVDFMTIACSFSTKPIGQNLFNTCMLLCLFAFFFFQKKNKRKQNTHKKNATKRSTSLPIPMKATQQPKLMHSTQSPLPPHSITLYTLGNIRILTLQCVHFCYSILSHSFFLSCFQQIFLWEISIIPRTDPIVWKFARIKFKPIRAVPSYLPTLAESVLFYFLLVVKSNDIDNIDSVTQRKITREEKRAKYFGFILKIFGFEF